MNAFSFDGRPIRFRDGQSVGAALIDAGVRSWRTTRRRGAPRGIFCGIGVCYDCLITIDGVANQRACISAAAPGLSVTTQVGTGHDDLTS
ncbi:MAG TPA: (2Fe-2S)-binding protein [Jatrophihabitans sp.]|nr:(2Fe-2S)-binding protein [Jatrophihabitans sp.]